MLFRIATAQFILLVPALAKLPSDWNPCPKANADYSKCLEKEVQKAIRYLKNGDRKLGVMPVDPFRFDKMLIDQGTGPVAIRLLFTNLGIVGISTVTITQVENDWKTLKVKGHVGKIQLNGDYSITGKVLVLPISGNGKCNNSLHDVDVDSVFKLGQFEKDGKKYFRTDELRIIINPKRSAFNFENLFNGDKALGDNMNLFLNENNEQIIEELKPAISRAVETGFIQVANRVFSHIPADQIDL